MRGKERLDRYQKLYRKLNNALDRQKQRVRDAIRMPYRLEYHARNRDKKNAQGKAYAFTHKASISEKARAKRLTLKPKHDSEKSEKGKMRAVVKSAAKGLAKLLSSNQYKFFIPDPVMRKAMRKRIFWDRERRWRKTGYERNRSKILLEKRAYHAKNKTVILQKSRIYRVSNREHRKEYMRDYAKKNSVVFNCRTRISRALRMAKLGKPFRTCKLLGCDWPTLRAHLEKQFQPGMTWDNHGYYGWHVDHIRPIATFDLRDQSQMLSAFHYTNLQPLWWKDNLSKPRKYMEGGQIAGH